MSVSGVDRPTFRRAGPRRRGEVASPQADLAAYDELLRRVPSDYPGLPLMLQRREELSQAVVGPPATLELHLDGGDVIGHSTSARPLSNFVRYLDEAVKELAKSIAGIGKLSGSLRVTPGFGSVLLTISAPQISADSGAALDMAAERIEVDGLRKLVALMAIAAADDDPTSSELSAAMFDLNPASRRSVAQFAKATADAEYEVSGSWSDSRNGTVQVNMGLAAAKRLRRTASETVDQVEYTTITGTVDGWEWSTSRLSFAPRTGKTFRASVPERLSRTVASLISDRELTVAARFAVHEKVARGSSMATKRAYTLEEIEVKGEQGNLRDEE